MRFAIDVLHALRSMNARGSSAACRATLLLLALAPVFAHAQGSAAPAPSPGPVTTDAAAWKVTPYGTVFFNGFSNSAGSNNADIPLWATGGPGSTSATARQSRFGFKVAGLAAGGGKLSAVAEADFFGGFPPIGNGDNMGILRLRLANARIDWKDTSLVVGQDWVVFAPGTPVSLACAGIPLMAAAGNPWARLPQVRLERRAGAFAFRAAVLAPSTGDFSSALLYQPASGALSERPFFQARAAIGTSNAHGTGRAATFGVSGHYGRAKVLGTEGAADAQVESTGVAADFSFPLVKRIALAGEAFAGRNLGGFQAGIFQGVNPDYGVPGPARSLVLVGPRSIGTHGGWAQLAASALPGRLSFYVTFGIDDPKDEDLVSVTRRDWRLENQVYALSFMHRMTAQLSWGIEARREKTRFLQSGTRRNDHVNLAMTLGF
jgi:hypothetical protein